MNTFQDLTLSERVILGSLLVDADISATFAMTANRTDETFAGIMIKRDLRGLHDDYLGVTADMWSNIHPSDKLAAIEANLDELDKLTQMLPGNS